MAEEKKGSVVEQINIVKVMQTIWKHRKTYFKIVPCVMVVAALLILCVPRYYRCSVTLAPELDNLSSSSLSDIASSFGFDIGGGGSSSDAILPELYPELISSVDFMTALFDVPVTSDDGSLHTTYYDYLTTHQKRPFWDKLFGGLRRLIGPKHDGEDEDVVDPFRLTFRQSGIVKGMQKNIICSVDKKNYVITITVEAQDKLICACMADTVTSRLQAAITQYRTNKARHDLAYTEQIYAEARAQYDEARRAYSEFADANNDLVLYRVQTHLNDLENEMQLQYNNYSTISAQLQAARARVQEQTPAFTTLQSATVPIKRAGPKRTLFVLIAGFLACVSTTIWALAKENRAEAAAAHSDSPCE